MVEWQKRIKQFLSLGPLARVYAIGLSLVATILIAMALEGTWPLTALITFVVMIIVGVIERFLAKRFKAESDQ